MGETLKDAALRLRDRFGEPVLEPAVEAWLSAHGQRPRLLVACSGGADSTALLLLLAARYAAEPGALRVAHYDHRWRGAASAVDADFVSGLAAGLGLSFVTGRRPDEVGASTETSARVLRLDFLRNAAAEFGADAIAFGHQRDDILETQLLRLARGSGSEGLSAPRPVQRFPARPIHLRPLLHRAADELRDALKDCGVAWREDATNTDTTILRNALRHDIIPGLRGALDRDPAKGAARSRRLLEEDASALDLLAREAMPQAFAGASTLDGRCLRVLPRALLRRALTAWLGAHQVLEGFSAAAVDALVDVVGRGDPGRFSVAGGFVVIEAGRVFLEKATAGAGEDLEPRRLRPGDVVGLPDGSAVQLEALRVDGPLREQILSGDVDCATTAFLAMEAPGEALVVRNWRDGDRFRPIGAPGTRKLQDWFTDRQIPVRERRRLPIVLNESGFVLWVPGFAPAGIRRIQPATEQALRLTYQCANPR